MKAGQGQTLLDVAVQCSGMAEAAWEIALRSGINITDGVDGVELDIPAVAADTDTAAAMAATSAHPATDGTPNRDLYATIGKLIIGKDKIG